MRPPTDGTKVPTGTHVYGRTRQLWRERLPSGSAWLRVAGAALKEHAALVVRISASREQDASYDISL